MKYFDVYLQKCHILWIVVLYGAVFWLAVESRFGSLDIWFEFEPNGRQGWRFLFMSCNRASRFLL